MNGPAAIRWSTIAAVTAVAAVAGWVSYEHALAVVRAHGEAGAVAQVYPVTVDGLIYSASMVLLDAARRGVRAPALARWLLACGIGATLAANVAAGLHFGPVGAIVAAWPAAALVGSYELLMLIIRSGARAEHPVAAAPGAPEPSPDPSLIRAALNGHAAKAERVFRADVAAGKVPGVRRIMREMHIGDARARLVQQHLEYVAASDGDSEAGRKPAGSNPSMSPGDTARNP